MDKPLLSTEEVVSKIQEKMRQIRKDNPSPSLKLQTSNQDEEAERLSKMDIEIRNNNLKWNIQTDRIITSHRKIFGRFIVFGKKVIRKFLRWYINPPFDQQREFNSNITNTLNTVGDLIRIHSQKQREQQSDISKMVDKEDLADIIKQISDLEEKMTGQVTYIANRLRQLDTNKTKSDIVPQKVIVSDKDKALDFDYFMFEHRFRGSRESVKEKQKDYLELFKGKNNVVDIGCGRGEFVELLIENGVGVTGIDINREMVNYCQGLGLPVIESDLFVYLETQADDSLDGIFAAQVIEHLTPAQIIDLIRLSYRKLKPTGVLLAETVNLHALIIFANQFYMDPSHEKPVHPTTVQFLMEGEGFKEIKFIYSNPVEDRKIPHLSLGGESGNLEEFNRGIESLNQLLYGPQDYAIVGIK
ncbi:class I SAM-dependent methyltransferase [Desulfotomaculum sp. 1211_IL3151]|uniref:class I SAM-dependent methyltransferase n=1 Tax=Desulfotomaculum sp. 1211_IL3151 TaxID=3084055 RepID=UPI002FDA161E